MSIFESFFLQSRLGAEDAKLWISWPLTLRSEDIDEIYGALRDSFEADQIRMYVNAKEVLLPAMHHGYASSPSQQIPQAARARGVRSVAFVAGDAVWVHLGPRLPYVYSLSTEARPIAALWRIRRILQRARWSFGAFLFRTWGAAIAVTAAAIASSFIFGSGETALARSVSAGLLGAALGVYLIAALIIGVFRRIRIDVRFPGEKSGEVLRWFGATLTALVVTVVGGLAVLAVWAFLSSGK